MGQYYNALLKHDDGTKVAYDPGSALYMTQKGWDWKQMQAFRAEHHKANGDGTTMFVPYPEEYHRNSYGLKLMENGLVGSRFVAGIVNTLREAPARVAWLGDYAGRSDDEDGYEGYDDYADYPNLTEEDYEYVWESDEDGGSFDRVPNAGDGLSGYLVNLDKGEYIDLGEADLESRFSVHPLVALTAIGNGRGGGDYYGSNMDMVGAWALDLLEVTDVEPEGFDQLDPEAFRFVEGQE